MASTYFAAVYRAEEGGFVATIPDLPGCFTQADDMDELNTMLQDALFVWLDGNEELGYAIPEPSSHEEVLERVGQEEDFLFLTMVTAPSKVKRERINISLTELDLAVIDHAANERGLDRSAFLVMAGRQLANSGQ